jgi:hypothetical protein
MPSIDGANELTSFIEALHCLKHAVGEYAVEEDVSNSLEAMGLMFGRRSSEC